MPAPYPGDRAPFVPVACGTELRVASRKAENRLTEKRKSMTDKKRLSPSDYAERDLAVLKFVPRHGIGLSEPLSETFFDGNPCGHVLRRLEAKGQLQLFSRALPGGHSYVTISSSGQKAIGLEAKKLPRLGTVGLNSAVAINWHVALEKEKRIKLFGKEVKELFQTAVPKNVPHVLTEEFGDISLMRVYHATGKLSSAKSFVVEFFEQIRTKEGVAAAFKAGEYGLTVLCPTTEKTEKVQAEFKKAGLFDRGRLLVALGPTAATYSSELKRKRK